MSQTRLGADRSERGAIDPVTTVGQGVNVVLRHSNEEYKNISPHVGFAWNPGFDRKSVFNVSGGVIL